MGDAAPVLRRGAAYCRPTICCSPKMSHRRKSTLQPPVRLRRGLAGDEALGLDGAPVAETRRHVDVGDALDERRRVRAAGTGPNAPDRRAPHRRDRVRGLRCGRAPTKSGMAIGRGSVTPCSMRICSAASAGAAVSSAASARPATESAGRNLDPCNHVRHRFRQSWQLIGPSSCVGSKVMTISRHAS